MKTTCKYERQTDKYTHTHTRTHIEYIFTHVSECLEPVTNKFSSSRSSCESLQVTLIKLNVRITNEGRRGEPDGWQTASGSEEVKKEEEVEVEE